MSKLYTAQDWIDMIDMKNKIDNKEQWFTDRIGKRVYRKLGSCKCKSCLIVAHEGLVIIDKQHANYLYLVSGETGIRYQDEPIIENVI